MSPLDMFVITCAWIGFFCGGIALGLMWREHWDEARRWRVAGRRRTIRDEYGNPPDVHGR